MATRLAAAMAKLSGLFVTSLALVLLFVPSASLAADPEIKPFVVGAIQVGTNPFDAAVSADGNTAYVVNNGSQNVSQINLATNQVVRTIQVGTNPASIAISPDGLFALVANYTSSDVTRINLNDYTTSTITTATGSFDGPRSVVFSPINGLTRAYISNNNTSTITVLNFGATMSVETITVNPNPADLAISKDGNTLYSSHVGAHRISFTQVNANPISTSILQLSEGALPDGIELTNDDSRLYVAQWGLSNIAVIDTTAKSMVTQIGGFSVPRTVTINPQGTQMFVADSGSNKVKIIDIATNIVSNQTLDVGTAPRQVTFVPNGLSFLTANFGSANVSAIQYFQVRTLAFATTSYTLGYGSTQTVVATPSAGDENGTITYSAGSSSACTVNASTGLVTVTEPSGTCAIQASITEGDAGVNVAPFQGVASATTAVTITPQAAPLTITAATQTVTLGGTVTPAYTITAGSLVSPDALSGVTYTFEGSGSTTYPASTTAPTEVGTYTVTPSAATFSTGDAANYAITYSPGSLVIQAQPVALTIAAESQTIQTRQSPSPQFAITSGALSGSDSISGVIYTFQGLGSTRYAASTTPPTAAGTYSITPSNAVFSSGSSASYTITYAPGTLTVEAPAPTPNTLPNTGTVVGAIGLIALALMLAGLLVLVMRRVSSGGVHR